MSSPELARVVTEAEGLFEAGLGKLGLLVSTTLDDLPTAMFARGDQVVGAASVGARLRYLARLVSTSSGEVIGRAQGEVFSTNQWTDAGGSSSTCKEATEAMDADITKQLLASLKDP